MIQNPRHNWQPKLINGQTMELMGILVQNYPSFKLFFFLLIAHVYFWLIQILCESKRNIKYKKHNNVSCVCVYTAVHTLAR